VVPALLESLLAATASLAEPRSFLAAAGAWRAVLARLVAAREAAEVGALYKFNPVDP
jgi:hypothetical protein